MSMVRRNSDNENSGGSSSPASSHQAPSRCLSKTAGILKAGGIKSPDTERSSSRQTVAPVSRVNDAADSCPRQRRLETEVAIHNILSGKADPSVGSATSSVGVSGEISAEDKDRGFRNKDKSSNSTDMWSPSKQQRRQQQRKQKQSPAPPPPPDGDADGDAAGESSPPTVVSTRSPRRTTVTTAGSTAAATSNKNSAAAAAGGGSSDTSLDGQQSMDDISRMTTDNDDSTVSSRLGRVKESVGSVIAQSMALLRGENPLLEAEEDGDDDEFALDAQQHNDFAAAATTNNSVIGGFDAPFPPLQNSIYSDTAPLKKDASMHDDTSRLRRKRKGSDLSEQSIDFLQDDPQNMTYSRRIALSLMNKYKWYNPQLADGIPSSEAKINGVLVEKNNEDIIEKQTKEDELIQPTAEKPSLQKAWAYFEHVTLPRHLFRPKPPSQKKSLCRRIIRKFQKADKTLDRAEPGEDHQQTRLYSPIFTPLKQMGDFGLGVGLYFSTLRAITVMTLVAGLINIPNLMYFSSHDYSSSQLGVPRLLKGSAICTQQPWVPCPDCNQTDFENGRIANATTTLLNGTEITILFARKNDCEGATYMQGFVNYATLIFIIAAMFLLSCYQRKKEIEFDEDEQTAQDYSIVITNPPIDALDPEEWRDFFAKKFDGAQVTCCTVAIDNDLLVRSLVERRECLRKIEMILPPGTSLDTLNLARLTAEVHLKRSPLQRFIAVIVPGVPELFGRVVVLNAKIQGLAQQSYPASNVFVTFETEAAQRRVLSALSVGSVTAWRNNTSALENPEHLFRGKHVLHVKEADEPSTVRWQDLNERFKDRLKQLLSTTIVSLGAVALIAFIVKICRDKSSLFAAIAISIFNSVFPIFAKLLTNLEAHSSEGGKQTSLYLKIAVFRWVNTAIVMTIITPFTSTLTNGSENLIPSIYAIFFAEIVTTNALQLADPFGHIKRHFLAPRAATQDLMNLHMQGTVYELAERYTNMTKILFLALWYCSIYPAAFFMCSFALLINFFTDRFSLMRSWKPAPQLGNRIAKFSRTYFFSLAIVAMAIISSYAWSGFPYDNLCQNDFPIGDDYDGIWKIENRDGEVIGQKAVSADQLAYRYCNQDLLRMQDVVAFPALSKYQPEEDQWMTEEQKTVTNVYGWTSVGVLVFVCIRFLLGSYKSVRNLFRGKYKPKGEDQGINFSDCPTISTYVPQVRSNIFSYPLIACSIDGIDEELFDWADPDKPFSYYDLTRDAEKLLRGIDVTKDASKHVFSKLCHWPPEEHEESGFVGITESHLSANSVLRDLNVKGSLAL